MLGKISSEKSAKNISLYSHEYRDQKMWGKKARINFSKNSGIVRAKNVGEKMSEKLRKTFFYIQTNIETKKCRAKNSRKNFSRNKSIVRAKNVGEKRSEEHTSELQSRLHLVCRLLQKTAYEM